MDFIATAIIAVGLLVYLGYAMLFASASGLDPHISPTSVQAHRISLARNVDASVIYDMIQNNIEGRQMKFLGEDRINVLNLNLALDQMHP